MVKVMPFVDMRLDAKEQADIMCPSPPTYPYGLCISLCEDELDKLGLGEDDIDIGDILHMHCLAQVTSKSSVDNVSGQSCRIELQIKFIAAEDEDEEDDEAEDVLSKLYH